MLNIPQEGREPELPDRSPERGCFDYPAVLFSFAAALNEKLNFVNRIMVLSQRQTVLVAWQAGEFDFLSPERLRLGVGGRGIAFALDTDADPKRRGSRFMEQCTRNKYIAA